MNQSNTFGKFALIHLIPFEMAILWWVGISIISNLSHSHYHLFNLIYTPLYVVVPTMLLLFPIYALFALYRTAPIPLGRLSVLYFFWLLIVIAVVTITVLCLAKKPPTLGMLFRATAVAHVFIVPWVLFAHFLTRRFLPNL